MAFSVFNYTFLTPQERIDLVASVPELKGRAQWLRSKADKVSTAVMAGMRLTQSEGEALAAVRNQVIEIETQVGIILAGVKETAEKLIAEGKITREQLRAAGLAGLGTPLHLAAVAAVAIALPLGLLLIVRTTKPAIIIAEAKAEGLRAADARADEFNRQRVAQGLPPLIPPSATIPLPSGPLEQVAKAGVGVAVAIAAGAALLFFGPSIAKALGGAALKGRRA